MKRLSVLILLLAGITLSFTASPASVDNQPLRLLPGPGQHQTGPKSQTATALRDIRGPVLLPTKTPWLLYGGATLILLLVSSALFIFLKNRKKNSAPEITPWDRALNGLKHAAGLKTGQPLRYTEQVSAVLREYVESRFGFKITRQTSTEFLRALKEQENNGIPSNWYDSLKTCFHLCDLAKFAHRIPDPEDVEIMEQSIISFIEQTRPVTKNREEEQ